MVYFKPTFASILSLLLCGFASGAMINNFAAVQHQSFDFIIVGGGTGGNVVANRLTENPSWNVLVLEAGPSNIGVLDSEVPWLAPELWNTPYDWNYTTVPQTALNGRVVEFPRGHLLGGSSSFNFMMYTRGSEDQYNDYANIAGDQGWSWSNLYQYFMKNEKWTAPADNHNTTGQYDPAIHSLTGMNAVSLAGYPTAIDHRVINTTQQLPQQFPYNEDYSSGDPLGVGWLQATIGGASRSDSATSYLGSQYINRTNLFVLVGAEVSRLIQTSGGSTPAFQAVEFRQNGGTNLTQVRANKEVILSAGSIGSPHVLLNSGIGNATTLQAIGITPLVNIPDVGQNLQDHAAVANPWLVTGTNTFEAFDSPSFAAQSLKQWEVNGTGPYVDTLVSQLGFFRLPANETPIPDPAPSGPTTPHYEFLISNGLIIPNPNVPANSNFFSIATALMSPASKGSVTLQSTNPFAAPLIDPAYMTNPVDLVVMRAAIESALAFVSAPAWSGYIVGPTGGLQNATVGVTNSTSGLDGLDEWILANTGTFFHPTSTNRMSAWNATGTGVVNPDLTVKGVKGLRIVDASVLPYIFAGHPQSAVYAYAERASDLIKAAW